MQMLIWVTAWKVDFNLSLLSMEPLIAGTRHLVDLALCSSRASLPKFVFVSSAGVFASRVFLALVSESLKEIHRRCEKVGVYS